MSRRIHAGLVSEVIFKDSVEHLTDDELFTLTLLGNGLCGLVDREREKRKAAAVTKHNKPHGGSEALDPNGKEK